MSTNLAFCRKGDKLIAEIDISPKALEAAKDSKTGKTKLVASTHGYTQVEGVSVSVNVTRR